MTQFQLLDNDDLVRWCKGLLTVLLVLHSLSFAFGFVLLYQTSEYSPSDLLDQITGLPGGTEYFENLYLFSSTVILIVTFAFVILYSQWVYRLARNAQSFSIHSFKISPGWAVAWYFIPFAFLIMPYRSMKEIYCVSTLGYYQDEFQLSWSVRIWWVTFVFGYMFDRIAGRIMSISDDVGGWRLATCFDLAYSVTHIVAAFLLMGIMDELLRLQKEMAAKRSSDLDGSETRQSFTEMKINYISPSNDHSPS